MQLSDIDRKVVGTLRSELRNRYGIKTLRKGKHKTFVMGLDDTWTIEDDFIWTTLTKYPSCAEIADTDEPEIQINIGKEEIHNHTVGSGYLDIDMIPNAEHPLVLPKAMYIRKGTPINFSRISISDPEDVKIAFGGYYPIRLTNHNPILFGHPYFKVARWTDVVASTPVHPISLEFQDWEEFTATHVVAFCRKKDTDNDVWLVTNDNFNIKVEVHGNDLLHRVGHRWLWCGTPNFPRKLDPPIDKLTATQIVCHIYPPAWDDSFCRRIYIVFYGIMKYRMENLKNRFTKPTMSYTTIPTKQTSSYAER